MELKVWVEGIQRVVCGVSDKTTCQDVVYALAHATGQTGRFTLVERWRHNERLLPPQEYPLKVLNKWGEYANDVQFILRRSHSDKKKTSQGGGNNACTSAIPINPNTSAANKRHHELRSFSPTSPPPPNIQPSANKLEIKKSLTFSGSHGGSSSESGQSTPNNHPALASPKVEEYHRNNKNRGDVPKGVVKGVPQKSSDHSHESIVKVKSDRPKQPPSYDEAVSRSSRHAQSSQMHTTTPPIAPSPLLLNASSDKDSPTNKRRHVAHASLSPTRIQPNRSLDRSSLPRELSNKRESPILANISPSRGHDPHKQYSPIPDFPSPTKNVTKARKNIAIQLDREESKQDQTENQSNEPGNDPQLRDLIRLVNLQREKLNSQHAELSQYDSEIVYWESKLQEQEERLANVEDELHLLEKRNAEHEEELSQLEEHQPLILDSIDQGRQEDRSLRSKLSVIRAQLANCETEVLQCRQKMRQLLEELAEERRRGVAEREEQEKETKRQLQDLEEELVKHNVESDKQQSSLDKLEEELKQLENKIGEKKREVDKVTEDMREVNLQSLSMTISEDIKYVAEGNFHNRSGSMRRIMGSPRQLENAVPTSKNPHGVWV